MKINELLKHLENIKIDEDKINEKYEIAEYLAQTFSHKKRRYLFYIMMKDKETIYDFDSYENLLGSNKLSPNDAYVFIVNDSFTGYNDSLGYFYPFLSHVFSLISEISLVDAYLSKLGFEAGFYRVVPATGLKYVAAVNRFSDANRTVVEVANIDTAAINMNLPTLIRGVLGTKHIDDSIVREIVSQLDSQKLFAGHGFMEAKEIIRKYYNDHDTSLAKDVEAIKDAYNRIFQPFRIEYDINTKQFQVSGSNEDRRNT
jgi:hypothetical protein